MTNKSGLRFKITAFYKDGTDQTIVTGPIDTIRWEKKSGRPFPAEIPDVERVLWVTWAAGRRQKLIDEADFEKWVESVDDFDRHDDDEDDVDPTQPEVSES